MAVRRVQCNASGVGPQSLDIVKTAHRIVKDVQDHMAVVQQRPVPLFDALGVEGFQALLFVFSQRQQLTLLVLKKQLQGSPGF